VLQEKQDRINKIKKQREEGMTSRTKYKFEEKIRGKSNLSFIDVETVEEKPDKDQEYFERIIKDYEEELKEI
jgi:hypothetical protein